MAAGDNYFKCSPNLGIDQAFRDMVYEGIDGKPVLHTNPSGTILPNYFNCSERKNLSLEQVFRQLILEDANGKPYLNITG
jgi:hypothetical protein